MLGSISRRVAGMRSIALASVTLLLIVMNSGCASPEMVPATKHAPSDPTYVAIYQKEPRKYENLGLIQEIVTPDMKWDERGDSTAGFEKLKAQAAAKGANGVLLKLPEGSFDYLVLAGYKGAYYQVPVKKGEPKTVMAAAIYMLEP